MDRVSFVFYKDWKEAIKDLPGDVRLEIYDGITEYAFSGNLPVLKPLANIAFNFVKAAIDRDSDTYNKRVAASQENGKKGAEYGKLGGRPRKTPKTPKTPNGDIKTPKTPDNDNDNDNENEKLIEVSPGGDTLSGGAPPDVPDTIDYKKFIDWFNSVTNGAFGIAKYPLGEKRKASIRARVREHGKQTLFDVIKKASESDFLKGNNQRGFVATLDWIIKPSNFEKILSGNYVRSNSRIQTKSAGLADDDIIAAVQAGMGLAAAAQEGGRD